MIGAGGFGREALDVVQAINGIGDGIFDVLGVVDDSPTALNLRRLGDLDVPYLGDIDQLIEGDNSVEYLVGIGSPEIRRSIGERLHGLGFTAAIAVHPRAGIGSHVRLGEGTVVCGGVQLSTNSSVGIHVHMNPNATVGHDADIGDYVSINPAATISGDVTIGTGALIGAGAVVLQGLTVGDHAVVGASACVVRPVEPGATVKGVPAR
ncbi:acetyltransferase [Lacisediminihabitans profunda]|uniref:acetyltransferase n=1 Tax=Lacisediminihabitans profunda TaxID=2594790 RepID=UPI001FE2E0E6|nr:acetyltransferase [Lacisediminihabitans profunda]